MFFANRRAQRKAQKLLELKKQLRSQIFGVIDMTNEDKVTYQDGGISFKVILTRAGVSWRDNKPFIAYVKVRSLCQGCQSEVIEKEFHSIDPWQIVWAEITSKRCGLCMRLRTKELERAENWMLDDDAHRERLTTAIEASSGTKPRFTDDGVMQHEQFDWLANNGWIPTWIAQDGSVEALDQLHALAGTFSVKLRAVEGFLVFPRVEVLPDYKRRRYQEDIDKLTAHKQLVDELTAKT